jgi:hypothetical protein
MVVQQQHQQQEVHQDGPGVSTRLRLRQVEVEEDTIQVQVPVLATAGPSSQRDQDMATSSGSSSSTAAQLLGGCGKSEKKGRPIKLGGPGKENVPPLVLNGHVLVGIDGSDDEGDHEHHHLRHQQRRRPNLDENDDPLDEDEDELNLRPTVGSSSTRRREARATASTAGMSVEVGPCSSPVGMSSSRAAGKQPEPRHAPSVPALPSTPTSSTGRKVLRKSRTMGSLSGALTPARSRSDGRGIKTRSGKVAGTTTDGDSGMDVDGEGDGDVFEMTDQEDEDEGVVLSVIETVPEEDEDANRRKRRRTEGGATANSALTSTTSSTLTSTGRSRSGLISSTNLQAVAEGGLNLPGPTGNPSSARSRFSTTSGMRTRSGTTIMPMPLQRSSTGRSRTGADTPSAASTSSGSGSTSLGAPRLGSRPRTLSQSSSHSSLNGVMMQVAAASSSGGNNGSSSATNGNNTTPGRLSRSVSYAYGFPASGESNISQSGQRGSQGSERRTLRRSDSSRSSMSLKRKDREMSVSSMISVRSENMSGEFGSRDVVTGSDRLTRRAVYSTSSLIVLDDLVIVQLFRTSADFFVHLKHFGPVRIGLRITFGRKASGYP